MGVCLCLYIPISLLLNGIVVSYTEAAWTLTYYAPRQAAG
jgi:hypothetical protein